MLCGDFVFVLLEVVTLKTLYLLVISFEKLYTNWLEIDLVFFCFFLIANKTCLKYQSIFSLYLNKRTGCYCMKLKHEFGS